MRADPFIRPMLLLASLVLAACSSSASSPSASPGGAAGSGQTAAPAPQTIKINYGEIGGTSDAGIYIAEDKGYFKEQGIELERNRFQTAVEMVAPLSVGQLDVG